MRFAEGKSIIVLDASGSMWGQIDGRAKLEIAREALGSVPAGMDPATEIGLIAYGHREKRNCADIELIVPPGPGTAAAITEAANTMKFLGKTPLTDAVRQAAAALKSTEAKATVILITDGIETCEADPCALGAELEASGVDFTAHVVGFGLTEDEGKAVACLAENTGGKYIQASDAGQLVEALKTTVAVAVAEPAPMPVAVPVPAPAALEQNFDPVVVLAEGQPEPEEAILRSAYITLERIGADGTSLGVEYSGYGAGPALVAPGNSRMVTELHKARVEQDLTVTADTLAAPGAVLNAGVLDLKLYAFAGGDVETDAFWEVLGPDNFVDNGYGQALQVIPAGEYAFSASFGAAKLDETVVFEAGKILKKDAILGTGLAAVEASYTEGLMVESGEHFVEILGVKKDNSGNRKAYGSNYGAGAKFNLPAGDYVAVVRLGGVRAESPFTIKVGERSDVLVPLNAGVVAMTTPTDEFIEVLSVKADINGNRTSFAHNYGPAWQTTLPEGDYIVVMSKRDVRLETPLTVKAGERMELALAFP